MYQHRRGLTPIANRLWIARQRAGFPQKWVAALLGHRSTSKISEYERGRKLPGLRTALKLSVIYQTPVAKLFPRLHAQLSREIESAKARHPQLRLREAERQRALTERGQPVLLTSTSR